MNPYPQGLYNSFKNNQLNFSYAHSVLQTLCFLDSSKKFFSFMKGNNMRNNRYFPLSNELLNIIEMVNSGNRADSQGIIFFFAQKYLENKDSLPSQNVLSPDPFHFYYFLLQFLHMETNMIKEHNNNFYELNFEDMKNDNKIYREFLLFVIKTHNSLVSADFYSSFRHIFNCPDCKFFFYYGIQPVLRMNLDAFRQMRDSKNPNKKGTKLDLKEILACYCSDIPTKCGHCNKEAVRQTKICLPAKTIIISLERQAHSLTPDVNFYLNFDFVDFISKSKTQGLNLNTNYELKAVISYYQFKNDGKYFADCKIRGGNMSDYWMRYVDFNYSIIQSDDLLKYEPQILIYEINNNNNNMQQQQQQQMQQNVPNINTNSQIKLNNFMMSGDNSLENMNNLNMMNEGTVPIDQSMLFNMQMKNLQNFSNNNIINVNYQMMNNPYMNQINQYNNNNSPNMKIDVGNQNIKNEMSIKEAQAQTKNMMNQFGLGYFFNGEFKLNI